MLDKRLSEQILSVGANWRDPKGGVAYVMANLAKHVYGIENFKCIVNSGGNNKISKLAINVKGLANYIYKLLSDKKIKIVHIHTASYNSFARASLFLNIAKKFGKKVILHIHGGGFKDYYQTDPEKILSTLQNADALAVLTNNWKEFFSGIGANHNIVVINNIIEKPDAISERKMGYPVRFLFLGAICDSKGIFDLVETIAEHKDSLRGKIELHIGGNGETKRLMDIVKDKQLEDIIKYHGFVAGEVKTKLFKTCNYYILPSYAEGLPLSIVEAMSYGMPVLSTPVGGIPEIVDSSVGTLFTPGNRIEIYDAIAAAVNCDVYQHKSELAKERATAFLPENVTSQIKDLYSILL